MSGDDLVLEVGYSGCNLGHPVDLCWNGLWIRTLPVQVDLQLDHDDLDEACDAYFSESHTFDLTAMRVEYQAGYPNSTPTIMINIGQLTVEYSF
jgi:hypothetical protein